MGRDISAALATTVAPALMAGELDAARMAALRELATPTPDYVVLAP